MKKEVPFEVAGQMSLLEDFPEVVPEVIPGDDLERAEVSADEDSDADLDVISQDDAASETNSIEYDREILEGMIQKAKEALDIMRDRWIRDQPRTYTKHSMELRAYEMLLQELKNREEGAV